MLKLHDLISAETKQTESSNKTSTASSTEGTDDSRREENHAQTAGQDDFLEGKQADGLCDSRSDESDAENDEPMSPGTLALLCDEKDTMFMAAGLPNGGTTHSDSMIQKSSSKNGCSELYAEQESLILTRFCDFLSRLITRGTIKGKYIYLF